MNEKYKNLRCVHQKAVKAEKKMEQRMKRFEGDDL
jgi:hypothetical protein